jgi:FAD/FMN-containing dehydrogenase
MFDPFFPAHELQYYWKSAYLADLGEEATRTVAEHVAARPSAKTMVATWALGGALGRADAPATAAGAEGAPYLLEILANWADPAEADANIDWARTFFDAMRPYGTGKTNVNFPGLGDDAEFGRAAFGDNWGRLVEVKRKYDPTNLFRLNQNIQP